MLNTKSPVPLHVQLKQLLEMEILNGSYIDKIPSERELMDRFSISRTTVRESISGLVRDGILKKKHGRGTFISHRPVQEWLGQISSYDETVKRMGLQPSSKLLYHGKVTKPKTVSNLLNLNEFYLIKRIRYADQKPIAIKEHFYPLEIGLSLAEHDLNKVVLYDLLESIGINLWESEQIITNGLISDEDATYLGLSPSSSIIVKEQIISNPEGELVEYSKSYFRPDMYSFRIKMSRKSER